LVFCAPFPWPNQRIAGVKASPSIFEQENATRIFKFFPFNGSRSAAAVAWLRHEFKLKNRSAGVYTEFLRGNVNESNDQN
jgi:hypothetical protein